MLNILYEKLPEDIIINDKAYPIVTDFRDWVAFFDMISDDELSQKEKLIMALRWFRNEIPPDISKAYSGLIEFASCTNLKYKPRVNGCSQKQILSYLYDSEYILGAFWQVYGVDLTATRMHWYKFNALLNALPEDVPLKKRMAYRAVNLSEIKDKGERRRIRKIKNEVRFPSRKITAEYAGEIFG
jgi:hypothetical protein